MDWVLEGLTSLRTLLTALTDPDSTHFVGILREKQLKSVYKDMDQQQSQPAKGHARNKSVTKGK